jgi:hypothetical protein
MNNITGKFADSVDAETLVGHPLQRSINGDYTSEVIGYNQESGSVILSDGKVIPETELYLYYTVEGGESR